MKEVLGDRGAGDLAFYNFSPVRMLLSANIAKIKAENTKRSAYK
jgi:hypothetical protein